MPRVKRGVTSRAKHKKVLKAVKGKFNQNVLLSLDYWVIIPRKK